ncbi:MAG: DNA starvation/stationary phase protection protein Dps [Candidatus Thermoplasmatota archaeon]|nr:DNA starvation/stationary phase protection protein Dps [Candidatus Thermoplasmatota archaeon]
MTPEKYGKTYKTGVNLEENLREGLISLLNQQLSDTSDLYSQTKQAHWNVKGETFYQLHELFDNIAGSVLEFVDKLAERITALGGYAKGTSRMVSAATALEEFPSDAVEGKDHLSALAARYASLAASTRKAIDQSNELLDAATADLFTEMLREIEKSLWFLEAHLQK